MHGKVLEFHPRCSMKCLKVLGATDIKMSLIG